MNGNKKPQKLKLEELGRLSIEEFKELEKLPVVVVLDNIRSMNNVGSIFRTSDAFKVEKIVLCGITPRPPHREITKSAIGATKSVKWEYEESIEKALQKLNDEGFTLVGIEQVRNSFSIKDLKLNTENKYAVVYGNEVEGLTENALDSYDFFVEIPQEGTKHSFNVSVSAGITLWEFYKQLS